MLLKARMGNDAEKEVGCGCVLGGLVLSVVVVVCVCVFCLGCGLLLLASVWLMTLSTYTHISLHPQHIQQLKIAAGEQAKITVLRLNKLLLSLGEQQHDASSGSRL